MKEKIFKITGFTFPGNISEMQYDGVYVKYDGTDAVIGYQTKAQKARCFFLLSTKVKNGENCFELSEKPVFDTCGPMLDLACVGVPIKVKYIKEYIDHVAALGMNMLMLYTEDMYELESYPMFGYLRGRYSMEELKEVDDYAYEIGVELIPCIQTLGHFSAYLRWSEAAAIKENATTILPGEEKTYEFIEAQIRTMRSCMRSNRIHLGMDEAVNLGLGTYLKKHGMEDAFDIFNKHLDRVIAIAKKYEYKPMIWSDMYFGAEDPLEYYNPDAVIPQHAVESAPAGVDMVFWDYYHEDYEYYDKKFIQHARFQNDTCFAGGIWNWDGPVPYFKYSLSSMIPALKCCVDRNIRTVIAAIWDYGDCDFTMSYEGLAIFSEYCYRGAACTKEDIYAAAEGISGNKAEFIDAVSDFYLGYQGSVGLGKGFFYTDPLLPLLCYDIAYEDVIKVYRNSRNVIEKYQDNPFYDFYRLIFDIVMLKADIVLNLKAEYDKGNKAYLENAYQNTLPALQKLYKEFYVVFMTNWHEKYKPFGVERTTTLFGGMDLRLEYAAKKLEAYCTGKLDTVEELDEAVVKGINKTWRRPIEYAWNKV